MGLGCVGLVTAAALRRSGHAARTPVIYALLALAGGGALIVYSRL